MTIQIRACRALLLPLMLVGTLMLTVVAAQVGGAAPPAPPTA